MIVPGRAVVLGAAVTTAATLVPAAPAVAASHLRPASTASYLTAAGGFRITVGYNCPSGFVALIDLTAEQNLGNGFVASGDGQNRLNLTCDGVRHRLRITVVPTGERAFTRGPAYLLADLTACSTSSDECEQASPERAITIR